MLTKEFVKGMMAGNKKLMKRADVRFITVTKYDELSVKNLYDKFIVLDGMAQYFPNGYPKGR